MGTGLGLRRAGCIRPTPERGPYPVSACPGAPPQALAMPKKVGLAPGDGRLEKTLEFLTQSQHWGGGRGAAPPLHLPLFLENIVSAFLRPFSCFTLTLTNCEKMTGRIADLPQSTEWHFLPQGSPLPLPPPALSVDQGLLGNFLLRGGGTKSFCFALIIPSSLVRVGESDTTNFDQTNPSS